MKQGLQILADFLDCTGSVSDLSNLKTLKKRVSGIIKRSGFTIVGNCHHEFFKGGSSLVFLVSESHVAVHTWPEYNSLNIDIFFCNYNKDNTKKAQKALKMFRDLYEPKKVNKKSIKRYY